MFLDVLQEYKLYYRIYNILFSSVYVIYTNVMYTKCLYNGNLAPS